MASWIRTYPVATAALALIFVACVVACGNRGSPKPPLPRVPVTPSEVTWRQRGDVLEVRAQFDVVSLGGRALAEPVQPTILHSNVPAARGWDAREFSARGSRIDLPAFAAEQIGERVERRESVAISQFPEGASTVSLALADARQLSRASPRVTWTPARPALPQVPRFEAVAQEQGIRLTWTAIDDEQVQSALIYRRIDQEPWSWGYWKKLPAKDLEAFDDAATYGQTLQYRITLSRSETMLIESQPVSSEPIEYVDVFAPAPPEDLEAVTERGAIRLVWWGGGASEPVDVVVERQTEGGPYVEMARVSSPDFSYRDDDVQQETRYRYRIFAVDAAGNRSATTPETDWVVPRPKR